MANQHRHYYGQPLTVKVAAGRLAIEIGAETLANAVAYASWANPWNQEKGDYLRTFAVTDPEQFAKDVCRALIDEREDGSTLLTDWLDKVSEAALDDGSEACEYEQEIACGKFAPSETWAAAREGR